MYERKCAECSRPPGRAREECSGSAAVNDKLSQQRAEAIVARLVELGISKSRLTAVGMGSKVPVADNSTDEGRAKNRRVEFVMK